jgi:penicillin-binding protein 2
VKRIGWRVAALGFVFAGFFAVLILRLWYLQVSTLATADEIAQSQQFRVVTIEAPRGDILARDGLELMAGTEASLRIIVDRQLVPEEREDGLIQNLSALLAMPASEIRATFDEQGIGARFPLGGEINEATGVFVLEHIEDFPGVTIEAVPQRIYPLAESAAHVIGYVGAPGADDLERSDITAQDRVGKFGIEGSYDRLLRGTPGRITYRVNADGEVLGIVEEIPPVPGGSVITTVDTELQEFLERSLMEGIRLARQLGEPVKRAAGVVLDPRDGSVIAMASVPSFDPGILVSGTITQEQWDELSRSAALNNFAIQGLYPPASAFKVIPYTLALERGIYPTIETVYEQKFINDPDRILDYQSRLDPSDPTSFYADGLLLFPATPPLTDWTCGALVDVNGELICTEGGHGLVDIHTALQRSSNQFFWGVALEIWQGRGPTTWGIDLLQEWARLLGFGEQTGVDLLFEQPGRVPDEEWFRYHQENATGLVREEGGWSAGDVMNIAIGQGALAATPLQMANAYAALVNGGTLWEPRVVESIRDSNNEVIFTNPPSVLRQLELSELTVASLREDLHGVVAGGLGTARVAFEGFGDTLSGVGGKTGTAETGLFRDAVDEDGEPILDEDGEPVEEKITTAWFVGAAPLDDPEFVVAIVIEHGGSGGQVAAPTARKVMQYLLGEQPDPIRSGEESER